MIELARADTRYPAMLRTVAGAPDPLWVDGDPAVFDATAVAIVGTRRMTGYGERVAREIAMACAAAGVVVVSGFAQGIDTAAHRGALDGGGRTIAVLGESIPVFVATVRGRRRPLVPRVRASGALLSQFAAPFSATPWAFVRRNATIAGLSRAVVVVEAGAGSGALITARDARRAGRPLLAVPGPLGSAASAGTNALIASGTARAVTAASDVLDAVGAAPRVAAAVQADLLIEALRDGPLGLDELAGRSGLPSREVTARVARLLVHGALRLRPDGRVERMS